MTLEFWLYSGLDSKGSLEATSPCSSRSTYKLVVQALAYHVNGGNQGHMILLVKFAGATAVVQSSVLPVYRHTQHMSSELSPSEDMGITLSCFWVVIGFRWELGTQLFRLGIYT